MQAKTTSEEYVIPNFAQTINNRTIVNIFESCKYRSPLIICALNDAVLAKEYSNSMAMGSGTITFMIDNDVDIMSSLYTTFRTVSTLLLMGNQLCVFIVVPMSVISTDALTAIAYAYRGAMIELRHYGRGDDYVQERLESLFKLSPLCGTPHMGPKYYGPTVFSELLDLSHHNKTSWYSVIDYSMFTRTALVGFASYLMKTLSLNSSIVNIVGYNPPYVWAAMMHGVTIRYIEKEIPNPKGKGPMGLIMPELNGRVLTNKVKYVLHNPQIKLLCLDSMMFMSSRNIVYIGAYPATHLLDMNLRGWNIYAVDPEITQQWISDMKAKTGANICASARKFMFDVSENVKINEFFGNQPYSIIDDSWVPDNYEQFQDKKRNYFQELVKSDQKVTLITMKWNTRKNVTCEKLLALLPQPYGGKLYEMRAFFHRNGIGSITIDANSVEKYIQKFQELPLGAQVGTQKFMHTMISRVQDVMSIQPKKGDVIIASYSLSNASNPKKKVLEYLTKASKSEAMIIFGAPNLERVKYMRERGVLPGNNITINGEKITFNNPSGKKWTDFGYTNSELLACDMIEVTIEQMVSFMSTSFRGTGYYSNSIYNDLFSWFIPVWVWNQTMQIQDIRLSPVALVKCFTTKIRNLCYVPHSTYYALRGHLVAKMFSENNIENNCYSISGKSNETFTVLRDFKFPTSIGVLEFKAGEKVNISGHLLSLAVAAHFVAVPVTMWARHIKYMTVDRQKPPDVDRILFFDNKIKRNTLERWHTKSEVILAALIAGEYVGLMLNNFHSKAIVDDLCNTVLATFR
uniref:Minor core structural protein n=1 Tax=Rice gall dwarf virus TaxID=10986 RepID=B5G4U2_RGDV|nr:minor core structural protein [Rice gall dwarf virus]